MRQLNNFLTSSRSECSSLGGMLASIHSKEEDEFIFSLIRPHTERYFGLTWIGASWVSRGVFEWDDSSPWDYQNWAEGNLHFLTFSVDVRSNYKYCKYNLQDSQITVATSVCSWAMMKIHQKSGQTVSANIHSHLTASVKEKLKRNKSTKLP